MLILYSIIFFSFKSGLEPWYPLFYITAGILIGSFIMFTIFGSTDEQSWNMDTMIVEHMEQSTPEKTTNIELQCNENLAHIEQA